MNLSLKNIYRLLMANDFPIYSESVIDEKNRKGHTLLKFWQGMMVNEFRCLPYGQLIWRDNGKRSRYISNLCNRNPELKFYGEYAKELTSRLDRQTLHSQIQQFMRFLSGKAYKHDILLRRVREFIRLCAAEDPCLTPKMEDKLIQSVDLDVYFGHFGDQGTLFHAGYLLTVLVLYAAAGEAMNDPVMEVLEESTYSAKSMWEERDQLCASDQNAVSFLTVRSGILQDNPLPRSSFFGRDEELYDLQEMAAQGRKCLISGIGGIGKTELLRQLIRGCAEDHTVDCIAAVPYAGSVVESFARAFPAFRRQEPEESFHHVLYQLEQRVKAGSKVLLLIDDLTAGVEEDPALGQIGALACGVLITSRRTQLEGFEVYRIQNPGVTTGTLIYRDNYGHPLTPQDRETLRGMLSRETLCHPLTLRLMAKAARSKEWSVQQLKEHLEANNVALTWVEGERTVKLEQMYRQLYAYSWVPKECQKIVELFTLLPMERYSQAFLEEVFPETVGSGAPVTERLELLVAGGWLEGRDSGYSMHPLIAQCLRRKNITEARMTPILQELRDGLDTFRLLERNADYDETAVRRFEILVYVSEFIRGSISMELTMDVIAAMGVVVLNQQTKERYLLWLNRLLKHCWNLLTEVLADRLRGKWQRCEPGRTEQLYLQAKENLTIPRGIFLDFCLYCGNGLPMHALRLREQLLQEVLCEDATPDQYVQACVYYSHMKRMTKSIEAARSWAKRGVKYLREHSECSKQIGFSALTAYASSCIEFKDISSALSILQELEPVANGMNPQEQAEYLHAMEVVSRERGQLEAALAYGLQRKEQILKYFGGKEYRYAEMLNSIAVTLRWMGRKEEALQYMQEALELYIQTDYKQMIAVAHNNISVVYMDLDQPEKALEHLRAAEPIIRQQGGIALAEGLKNMARAYGQLGEEAREQACLEEAVPLLEAAYGPEHPRAADARNRLEELVGDL